MKWEGGPVQVTLADGTTVALTGRAAELAEWIARWSQELTAMEYGTLTFDMTAGDVKPRLLRTYPAIKRKGKD